MLLVIRHILEDVPNTNYGNEDPDENTSGLKKTKVKDNKYSGLRDMAFSVTPDKLNLTLPTDKTIVFGTIIDWDFKGATITATAFQTGDASLYFSSGYIMMGGYAHESIRKVAKDLVSSSQKYLSKTEKAYSTPLPEKGYAKIYFLTNIGKYVHQIRMENIYQEQNDWDILLTKGQNIITQYRLIEPNL